MPSCDLCQRKPATVDNLLCQPCAEAIGRLMTIAQWAKNRPKDRWVNNYQAELLLQEMAKYAKP